MVAMATCMPLSTLPAVLMVMTSSSSNVEPGDYSMFFRRGVHLGIYAKPRAVFQNKIFKNIQNIPKSLTAFEMIRASVQGYPLDT